MGGKGGGSGTSINVPNMANVKVEESPYEKQLASMASQLFSQTNPLRGYFVEDFTNFLRPPGVTTQTGSSTGTTTGTTGSQAGAVPTYNDIYKNMNELYTAAAPTGVGRNNWDFNYAAGQRDYMIDLGYDPFSAQMMQEVSALPLDSAGVPTGLNDWTKNKAQSIFNEKVAQAMQTMGGQSSQQQQQSTTPSGFTSSALYNPYNLPAYAPLYQLARTGMESQYNPARENIMSSTPRGGALYENLANLEMSRAQQAGALPASLAAPLIQDLYNKAYGVAWNTPQTSISGLTGAEQGLASRYGSLLGAQSSANSTAAAAAMQQNALNQQAGLSTAGGLGALAGMGVKAAMK